jgi:hypothetical protein
MTNQTTAARAGRLVGISYRETARVLRMIDWREVGSIVLRCLVALVVLTYVLGEATGRWTHRTNDGLAALWVRLWVVDHGVTTTPVVDHATATCEQQTADVLAVELCQPTPTAVVTVELARAMLAEGMSQRAVSRELQVPRTTLRRMLARA